MGEQRLNVNCPALLHTIPNVSLPCLSKEPSSIPLQLGLIELLASRRGSLTQSSTTRYGADGTNPVFCDLGEDFSDAQ